MNFTKTALSISLVAIFAAALPAHALTPVQLTNNSTADNYPQIKNNQIVWQGKVNGNWEIFHHNLTNAMTTQITMNTVDDINPQTDGNYIAWLGNFTMPTVSYYDIASGTTSTIPAIPDVNNYSSVVIANGKIAWAAGTDLQEIYLYDIASGTTTNISNSPLSDMSPMINADTVAWSQPDAGDPADENDDIIRTMLYDIATSTVSEAPADYIWPDSPLRDGAISVSTRMDGSDRDLFVRYNSNPLTQVTADDIEDSSASISGDSIVWLKGVADAADIYTATFIHTDSDGIPDSFDNCPAVDNPTQLDTDSNGVGDACETDTDTDGVIDDLDNCPAVPNSDQLDSDGDGIGDACEADSDGDTIIDDIDNCIDVANTDQLDSDNNGVGDACEVAIDSAIYTPAAGSTLDSTIVTFRWNDVGAMMYSIKVGTAYGKSDIYYRTYAGSANTTYYKGVDQGVIPNLPNDGSTIYVSFITRYGNAPNTTYEYDHYTYTAATNAPRMMTSPVNGSTLNGTTVTFQWQDSGSPSYGLYIGTTPGGSDLYYKPSYQLGNVTSVSVPNLPSDGSPLYVKLYSQVNGEWIYDNYSYTAYTDPSDPQGPYEPTPAELLTPVPGSTLDGTSVTFTKEDIGQESTYLYIGTYVGGSNLGWASFNTAEKTMSNLPSNGSTIYVRLKSSFKRTPDGSSVWVYRDYTYTAVTQ